MASRNGLEHSISQAAHKVLSDRKASVLDKVRASYVIGECPLHPTLLAKRQELEEVWAVVKIAMDKNLAAHQLAGMREISTQRAYTLVHEACAIFGELGHVTPELGRVLTTSYLSQIIQKAMTTEEPQLETALKALKLYARVTGADTFTEDEKKDIPVLPRLVGLSDDTKTLLKTAIDEAEDLPDDYDDYDEEES